MPARRHVLRLIGGSALVLGAAGAGWWLTRDPQAARAPWERAGGREDPRLDALSYAVLAPNPHNLQPWLLDLDGAGDEIALFADPDRRLPETDPFDRQIVIGLGCFLETLAVAAAERGLRAEVDPFPEGADPARLDARPVARVRLSPGGVSDPLFPQILRRRTNKEPYAARAVPPETLRALEAAAPGVATEAAPERVAALADLGWRAHLKESLTPRAMRESVDLMRFGRAQIEASPDGIDLGGPFLEALWRLGQLDREALNDPGSAAFRRGLDLYRELFDTAAAWLWLTGPAGRAGEVAAGRAWMRLALVAASLGVDLHPFSQSLQEYPEMAELYAEVHGRLGVDPASGTRVHMLARLGYGPQVAASPRWPLETRIRSA